MGLGHRKKTIREIGELGRARKILQAITRNLNRVERKRGDLRVSNERNFATMARLSESRS